MASENKRTKHCMNIDLRAGGGVRGAATPPPPATEIM